ncbi:MAG: hypothetical protein M0001_15730 [Treponema sp.]|nr:hypothetical protein [Treponema sp.]
MLSDTTLIALQYHGVLESSSWEVGDTTSKTCDFSIKITNSGQSKITQTTVSVSVTTNARTYYKTIDSTETILPGGSVFADGSVGYASATESLASGGVTIVGQFYQ